MPFGIKSAPEIFQQRMHQALEDLTGVELMANDILVYESGDNVEDAKRDHEKKIFELY